jgi:putative Mg2+ transporter-C (MgtC) family protein
MPEMLTELWDILVPLLIAGLLGGCIGWEREAARKAAGLRTHMLVSLGCCGFMAISMRFAQEQAALDDGFTIALDRVIQGVITGMGFVGGGAILHYKDHIKGLTTATGIWVAGAVGLACGLREYIAAVVLTVLALTVLLALHDVKQKAQEQSDADPEETEAPDDSSE